MLSQHDRLVYADELVSRQNANVAGAGFIPARLGRLDVYHVRLTLTTTGSINTGASTATAFILRLERAHEWHVSEAVIGQVCGQFGLGGAHLRYRRRVIGDTTDPSAKNLRVKGTDAVFAPGVGQQDTDDWWHAWG